MKTDELDTLFLFDSALSLRVGQKASCRGFLLIFPSKRCMWNIAFQSLKPYLHYYNVHIHQTY